MDKEKVSIWFSKDGEDVLNGDQNVEKVLTFKAKHYWVNTLFTLGLSACIREISVSKKGLVIKSLFRNYEYAWSEIINAKFIKISVSNKGGAYQSPVLVLQTVNKRICFDPNGFENGVELLETALPKHIKILRVKEKSNTIATIFLWVVVVSILFQCIRTSNYLLAFGLSVLCVTLYYIYIFKILNKA